jgi:hypothetical protein
MTHDRSTKALRELVEYILAHGYIDNHGHRREDSNCDACRVLNQAEDALKDSWVPESAPTFRPWTKDIK